MDRLSPSKKDQAAAEAGLLERLVAPTAGGEAGQASPPRDASRTPRASRASRVSRRSSRSPRSGVGDDEEEDGSPRTCRRRLQILLEEPESGFWAGWLSVTIWVTVVVSLAAVTMESIATFDPNVHPGWGPTWDAVELVVVTVFSLDYVLRFWASNLGTIAFITKATNVIDLVSVLPFYLVLMGRLLPQAGKDSNSVKLVWLRVLRLGRLLRVFKFSKYHALLEVLIRTFSSALEALVLLACCLGVGTVFFGGLMWTVEQGNWDQAVGCYVRDDDDGKCSPFGSLPSAFYWAVTTLTTVGYGDLTPSSGVGRLIAGMTMLGGIIALALPVSVICSHFDKAIEAHAEERKQKAKKKRLKEGRSTPQQQDMLELEAEMEELLNRLGEITPQLGEVLLEDLELRHADTAHAGELVKTMQTSYAALDQALQMAASHYKLFVHKVLHESAAPMGSLDQAERDYKVAAFGGEPHHVCAIL